MKNQTKCEYDSCNKSGTPFPAWQGVEPIAILCDEHAQDMAFCGWCTGYFGGAEADEWNIYRTGYCLECEELVRLEIEGVEDEWEVY